MFFAPRFFGLALLLVTLGSGCQAGHSSSGSATSKANLRSDNGLGQLSAAEQTSRQFQFLPDDAFEIRQSMPGGGVFAQNLETPTSGTRLVSLQAFVPRSLAALRWSAITDDAEHPATAVGALARLDLRTAHEILLPLFWPEDDTPWIQGTSGLWVSDEVFQELTHTHQANVNFGLFDARVQSAFMRWPAGLAVIEKIRQAAEQVGRRQETTLLRAETKPGEMTLSVNGSAVKVAVIKAHDWFGDVVILNNEQNPIILQLTLRQGGKSWFDYRADHFILSAFH